MMRRGWAMAAMLALGGCVGHVLPPVQPGLLRNDGVPARRPVTAVPIAPMPVGAGAGDTAAGPLPGVRVAAMLGVVAGPAVYTLPIDEGGAGVALDAFRATCPALLRREDISRLTRPTDWQRACDAARQVGAGEARAFFVDWFEAVQVGDGRAFATGYYEPEIAAARERSPGYDVPIYSRPADLIEVDLGQFVATLKGKRIRGRVVGGTLLPYPDRAAIEAGALAGKARIIAWAADPAEFFFVQVQGSGRLRLPDGSTIRIGYAAQNGRDYVGIGALLRRRGLLTAGGSMQAIIDWLHGHPAEAPGVLDEDKSYVFFREASGAPLGALGIGVIGGVSAAVDPDFIPLGAPVFLSLDRVDASRLWVAQDSGGAIKGANRVDTFWGAGDAARAIAGGMAAHGTAFLLLPIGTLARLRNAALDGGARLGNGSGLENGTRLENGAGFENGAGADGGADGGASVKR